MRSIHVKSNAWAQEFHACQDVEAQVIGGVASGKSQEASAWLIEKACEFPKSRLYYMGAAYPSMREGTAVTLCERLDDYGFSYTFTRSTLEIVVTSGPARGARFVPTSSETYKRLKGQMIDFIWCDEAQEWNNGSDVIGGYAYDFVLTRLRISESAQKHHPGLQPQIRLTANPPHRTSHWLYQKFVKQHQGRLFHVTTYDNALLTNREAYIDMLRGSMSPELFDIEVRGKWGNLGVGTVYTQFDQARHVVPSIDYDPDLPIEWTHDFGVAPRVSVIIQERNGGPGEQRVIPQIIDEIRMLNGSTDEMIEEFILRYPPERVTKIRLYGDPAGQARNSTTGKSDWQLLMSDPRLVEYDIEVCRRSAAPLIVDRVNAVNSKLRNAKDEIGVQFARRCEHTIDDVQHTRWKDGARQLDHGSPARGILRTHLSDALGYYIEYRWPIYGSTMTWGKARNLK